MKLRTRPAFRHPRPARLARAHGSFRLPARHTVLCALLLALLAAGAPLLCLLPWPRAGGSGAAGGTEPGIGLGATPAPATPTAPAATARPAIHQDPLLVWDDADGTLLNLTVPEYLLGAAACELPPDWPDEAIRAQMVACHSYILYQKANGTPRQGTEGAYLVVNSALSSGWAGKDVLYSRWGGDYPENYARFQTLAESVQYDLLLYDGKPAAACYHSISAGRTEASGRVWRESLPYLQGVDSAWDKYADGYEVTIEYSSQQFHDALAMNLNTEPTGSPDTWVGDTVWDDAGYVESITLGGQVFAGTQVRQALSLRSTCFAVAWKNSEFVVTTRGYGHGVGLSQYGAYSMAKGGSSWQQILAYYFPGTTVGQG